MIDLLALAQEAGATALESTANELQDEHRDASGPLPPLGGVFGVPLFVDERVAQSATLTFRAFNAGNTSRSCTKTSRDSSVRAWRPSRKPVSCLRELHRFDGNTRCFARARQQCCSGERQGG